MKFFNAEARNRTPVRTSALRTTCGRGISLWVVATHRDATKPSGARAERRRDRSWSSELELEESGVRGQYAGVRSWRDKLELELGVRGQGSVRRSQELER